MDLYLPPKPAIIRPDKRILTPAEVRGMLVVNPLIGFGVQKAAAAALTMSVVDTLGATGLTPALPTGSAAGDACFLLQMHQNSTSTAVPDASIAGWTKIGTTAAVLTSRGTRISAFCKILDAADITAGVASGGLQGDFNRNNKLITLTPSKPLTSITPSGYLGQTTTGDPTAQTIVVTGLLAPGILIGMTYNRGATVTPSGTLVTSGTVFNGSTSYPAYYELTNVDPIVSRTMDGNDNAADACALMSFAATFA